MRNRFSQIENYFIDHHTEEGIIENTLSTYVAYIESLNLTMEDKIVYLAKDMIDANSCVKVYQKHKELSTYFQKKLKIIQALTNSFQLRIKKQSAKALAELNISLSQLIGPSHSVRDFDGVPFVSQNIDVDNIAWKEHTSQISLANRFLNRATPDEIHRKLKSLTTVDLMNGRNREHQLVEDIITGKMYVSDALELYTLLMVIANATTNFPREDRLKISMPQGMIYKAASAKCGSISALEALYNREARNNAERKHIARLQDKRTSAFGEIIENE